MFKSMKIAILATAAFATIAVPLASSASADDWGWRDRGYYRHHRGHRGGDALAAGAIGLAAGALIGGALAQPREPDVVYRDYDDRPVYRAAPVRVYREVRPAYYGSAQPWSQSWYRYCADRYRSFNPETGTFRGYDGREYFCNAN
ncbi:BA14K family protein [Phyllobacterium sp. TAF24]|uniref:BA14K family protein n=1 Tax=unclassified Phyllobacterium TaxID=2638441 RepID=UPI0008869405|nr:BA14K family protein [Phyllobacterium sp. OV277]SDO08855.1 BA14K-like protein [Phyllobacterium sp. OV277]